ncbi:hypothetical protein AJ78_02956 [Emergomyces pasteurianus Ep9510]|uniref:Uncharacterized protein n=1 Tax=Emergomyces pasteurianus Ep9510 TaxID=1447872 RepID=A0A1J9QL53_9EURO|nr:hypothetical protein AJ78_02956 [Emergomyces pasteurianus Ep9510]
MAVVNPRGERRAFIYSFGPLCDRSTKKARQPEKPTPAQEEPTSVRIADQPRPSPVGGDAEGAPQPPTPSRFNSTVPGMGSARTMDESNTNPPRRMRTSGTRRLVHTCSYSLAYTASSHVQLCAFTLYHTILASLHGVRGTGHAPESPMRLQLARVHIAGIFLPGLIGHTARSPHWS